MAMQQFLVKLVNLRSCALAFKEHINVATECAVVDAHLRGDLTQTFALVVCVHQRRAKADGRLGENLRCLDSSLGV